MRAIINERKWNEYHLDTPFALEDVRGKTPEDVKKMAGACVKGMQNPKDKSYSYYGKVSFYSEYGDRAVVISHPSDKKFTVWEGSVAEFDKMWDCD
jgi:hypothetical protein